MRHLMFILAVTVFSLDDANTHSDLAILHVLLALRDNTVVLHALVLGICPFADKARYSSTTYCSEKYQVSYL